MAFTVFNPLRWLTLFILLIICLPVATFAVVTTTLAAAALLIRVYLVYIELGFALLRSWLVADRPSRSSTRAITRRSSSAYSSSLRRKKRPSSGRRAVAAQDTTFSRKAPTKSESVISLAGAGALDRDFEGVGGWKLSGDSHDDDLWIGMNSRLELPAASGGRQRKHSRSLTSGSQRLYYYSPESTYMSPAQSRRTTPPMMEGAAGPEGYFSMQPYRRIGTSFEALTRARLGERRKSLGGSTPSSEGSGRGPKAIASR